MRMWFFWRAACAARRLTGCGGRLPSSEGFRPDPASGSSDASGCKGPRGMLHSAQIRLSAVMPLACNLAEMVVGRQEVAHTQRPVAMDILIRT